jgi:hypothetical protein
LAELADCSGTPLLDTVERIQQNNRLMPNDVVEPDSPTARAGFPARFG